MSGIRGGHSIKNGHRVIQNVLIYSGVPVKIPIIPKVLIEFFSEEIDIKVTP